MGRQYGAQSGSVGLPGRAFARPRMVAFRREGVHGGGRARADRRTWLRKTVGRNGGALRPVRQRHHRSLLRLGTAVVMYRLCPLHLRSGLRCRARLCTCLSLKTYQKPRERAGGWVWSWPTPPAPASSRRGHLSRQGAGQAVDPPRAHRAARDQLEGIATCARPGLRNRPILFGIADRTPKPLTMTMPSPRNARNDDPLT